MLLCAKNSFTWDRNNLPHLLRLFSTSGWETLSLNSYVTLSYTRSLLWNLQPWNVCRCTGQRSMSYKQNHSKGLAESVWMGGEKKAGSLSKVKKCWFSLQSVSFWDISILETKSRVPWNPRHLQVKLKAWISSETREVFTPVPLVHIIYNMLCHYFVSIPLVSDHVHCMGISACPSPSTRHNANGVTEPRSEWSQAM